MVVLKNRIKSAEFKDAFDILRDLNDSYTDYKKELEIAINLFYKYMPEVNAILKDLSYGKEAGSKTRKNLDLYLGYITESALYLKRLTGNKEFVDLANELSEAVNNNIG